MPRVRYKAERPGPYHGPTGVWMPGEEREVSDSLAAHLLGPLSDWFEEVKAPKAAPEPRAVDSAPDRAYRNGKKK